MNLSKAIEGFLLQKSVEGLSTTTLNTYKNQLKRLAQFLSDPAVASITSDDVRRFLHFLRHEYVPPRWSGNPAPLTGRTLRNYWIVCRSFYTWAEAELGIPDAMNGIPAPKPNTAQSEPFTQMEVKAMLKAANTLRDQAILLVLLDTGIRSSELCALKVSDADLKVGKIFVQGKGKKERYCYLGDMARRSLWRYLAERSHTPMNRCFQPEGGGLGRNTGYMA